MGAYTATGKDLMLNALKGTTPAAPITHAGLFDSDTPITGITSTGTPDTFTKTSHGLANTNLIVFTSLTGGTGLVVGRPYFVINQATNTFQLADTSGGSAIDASSDVSAGTLIRLVEISGGAPAYARVAIAFAASASGLMDDSTNGAVFNVPAGATVDYCGFFSASTAGTCQAIDDLTAEAFAGQGTYTLTDAKLDLLAVA